MKKVWLFVIIIAVIIVAVLWFTVSVRNSLIAMDESVNANWSQIETQLHFGERQPIEMRRERERLSETCLNWIWKTKSTSRKIGRQQERRRLQACGRLMLRGKSLWSLVQASLVVPVCRIGRCC